MAGLEDAGGALPHCVGHRDRLRARFGRDWGAGMESYAPSYLSHSYVDQ
jgi:hypothetical protein